MKRTLLALAAAAAVCGGCAHSEKISDANSARYVAFAAQERSMDVVKMEFANGMGLAPGSITITGLTSLALSVPLTSLANPPQQKSLAGELMDGAKAIAPYAMGAYLGGKALDGAGDGASSTTSKVNNNNGAVTGNITQ